MSPEEKPPQTLPPQQEEPRDLGFGSVVSQEAKHRLLNRDGSFNVKRKGMGVEFSPYHTLLTMGNWTFYGMVLGSYVVLNMVFALAYMACGPEALEGTMSQTGFARAFFFSVHTFSTIGYGNVVPVSTSANIIVSVESLVGLMGFAFATAMMFARFSRPTARILYSESAVIAPYREMSAFMFRVTNARSNQIIELEAKVIFSRFEDTPKGRMRQYYLLPLERSRVSFFPLTWTLVHPIDASSPLHGATANDMLANQSEFLVLLTGMDDTFSQTVHSRSSYRAEELIWNARFRSVFVQEGNDLVVDLERFHQIEQLSG